jgi:hypothetical protein
MTSPAPVQPRRRFSVRRVLLITVATFVILGAIAIFNLVTLSRDAAALRGTLVAASGGEPRLRVQASVGPVLCSVVRTGLRWIDSAPPEARHALAPLRGASVAVYTMTEAATIERCSEMLATASAEMRRRGWTRAVAVQDRGDLVLVFTPARQNWFGPLRVCVAVCSGQELIVAEARLAERELAEFIANQYPTWRTL